MNLNPYVFSESLSRKGYIFTEHLNAGLLSREIQQVMVFHPEFAIGKNMAYIVKAQLLTPELCSGSAMVFCVGYTDLSVENGNLLVFPSSVDSLRLYLDIQAIYEEYQNWERKMLYLLGGNGSMRAMAECCLPFVQNPIAIASSDLRILAYAEDPNKPEKYRCFKPEDIGQYLSNEEIEAFKYDPDYVSGIATRTPQILNNDFFGFRHFYNNIYTSDIYIARVVICEVDRPIRRGDYLLLLAMTELFTMALVNQDISLNNHPPRFDDALRSLLGRENMTREKLQESLQLLGWKVEDTFFCCTFENSFDRRIHSTQSLCRHLENQITGSICLVFRERILMVVNLDRTDRAREDLRIRISELVRENILKVGFSNLFYDFYQLPWYLEQAEEALHFGAMLDESFWCYNYDDYALHSMLSRVRGDRDLDALCPEKLQLLIRYDQLHGRNYVQVLRAYLENNMSAVKTTRVLYMQRATLLYQLRRIEEISGLDLNNCAVRLHLLNYFGLCDLKK